MAGTSPRCWKDGSRLSQLDRHLLKLERFLAFISGLAVFWD